MVTLISPKRRRTLPVTTFLISTVLLSIVLPSLAGASPLVSSHALTGRHEDEGIDMDMDMGGMHDDEGSLDDEEEHTHAGTTDITENIPSPSSSSAVTSPSTSSHSHPTTNHPHPPSAHDHGSHTPPKEKLDDEAVHALHHFPPTYLDADFRLDNDTAIFGEEFDESWDPQEVPSHQGLMALHGVLYYGAYFGLLPTSLALRAADHPSHHLANAVFLVVAVLGWMAGKAYKAGHEDRYEGAVHESLSNILLLVSIGLTIIDSLEIIKRCLKFYKQHDRSWSAFVHEVLSSEHKNEEWPANKYEMVGLVDGEQGHEHGHENEVVFAVGDDEDGDEVENLPTSNSGAGKPQRPPLLIRQWTPPSRNSTGSEGTLQDTPGASSSNNSFMHKSTHLNKAGAYDAHPEEHHDSDHEEEHHVQPIWSRRKSTGIKRAVEIGLTWIRRSQLIFAYVVFLTEFVEYTGMCRAGLINSCAAHYIKGSIFFWYGVLTFARYLGAYADLGWAWNKRPGGVGVSAEMVECAVIFTYGITNTWMERFGSSPDDPYTVKQVQHISIAVMFWFAGLSGMLLESRWVRKVMGSFISGGRRDVHEPPTYAFSYNPLPALVIGVTGLAMAAHHQEYIFQVSIHSLWGTLLAGGSLFRFLTYFFLFLRPPVESTLPSRPPTEVLTSFGYAAGGIVFMLSNEEIAWAAMRAGWDDMMAFLNFTIALTCLVFCWSVVIMAVKGWAGLRMSRKREGIVIA
ncbi:hypothetical protein I302_107566 [Kwoniella bestiolae CBS 10118]|uniref:Uncharacterized protein n=1 Tax=Kwoniella bestiolae CBS 10118 TaxID=1296100 RepID=A0A1B9FY69_9TREE|nr:hypothetical protein I302_06694 [Kwoniella bestiolae CBS 10118]OCF23711.1 hypothetical protein I302_06694 [Kwoniella bestiolae CBS 10118]